MQQQEIVDLAFDDESNQSRERSPSPDLLASSPENSPPRARRRNNNESNGLSIRSSATSSGFSSRNRQNGQQVISLVNSPENLPSRHNRASRSSSLRDNSNQNQSTDDQWPCQRCTLLNPQNQSHCSACENPRHDDDEVIYERTTRSNNNFQQNHNNARNTPTSHYVGGGAFLGGMLGAADAYANGTGVAGGAMRGAVSGAVGGVLMGEAFRPVPQPSYPSVAAAAGSGYRTRSTASGAAASQNYMQHAATSASSANQRFPRHPNTSYAQHVSNSYPMYQHAYIQNRTNLFDHFLQSMVPRPQPNIDNMSYERLLEVFGDGNENRNLAASPQVISSLPSSKISNPQELPEDKRQCVICMEEYEAGDERTMLPCWHGFHKECVNRWLESKGCCPVCKTEVG